MIKPNHVIKDHEFISIAKRKAQSTKNKLMWRIITVVTFALIIYDLFIYQKIYSLLAQFGLVLLYIRYTFPKIKEKKRIIVWCFLSTFLSFTIIVQEIGYIIFAIPFYIWASLIREHEEVAFPIEVRFYDDYLVIYREKRYHTRNTIARQYDKIYYNEVKEIVLGKYPKGAINIYGNVEILRHKYDKAGRIVEKPIFNKKVDAFCYIYTHPSQKTDFINEIERHTPFTVKIEDSENQAS